MAGLRAGCLPLAAEVGRYIGTLCSDRVCRLCNCVGGGGSASPF